jgi:hypothetical protein
MGRHSTNNLNDGYIGSGTLFLATVEQYGRENFTTEILEYLDDYEHLVVREKEIVNEDLLNDPMCLNMTEGGEGDWTTHNRDPKNRHHRQKGAQKMNDILREDREFQKRNSERARERAIRLHKEGKMKIPSFVGLFHTKESKELMSKTHQENCHQQGEKNSQSGMMWILHLKTFESTRIKKDESIPEGWVKGRKMKKSVQNSNKML